MIGDYIIQKSIHYGIIMQSLIDLMKKEAMKDFMLKFLETNDEEIDEDNFSSLFNKINLKTFEGRNL